MKVQNLFYNKSCLPLVKVCQYVIHASGLLLHFYITKQVTEENQFTSAPSVTQGGKSSVPE